MYKYETHCHTYPVSKCGKASVEETVSFYKQMGYDGIFITNHFLDGNINPVVWEMPYPDQIEYYFSDYEKAAAFGREIGIKVFPGVELSYKGTDFLIYGLDKDWHKAHPEILSMKKTDELALMMAEGGCDTGASLQGSSLHRSHPPVSEGCSWCGGDQFLSGMGIQ